MRIAIYAAIILFCYVSTHNVMAARKKQLDEGEGYDAEDKTSYEGSKLKSKKHKQTDSSEEVVHYEKEQKCGKRGCNQEINGELNNKYSKKYNKNDDNSRQYEAVGSKRSNKKQKEEVTDKYNTAYKKVKKGNYGDVGHEEKAAPKRRKQNNVAMQDELETADESSSEEEKVNSRKQVKVNQREPKNEDNTEESSNEGDDESGYDEEEEEVEEEVVVIKKTKKGKNKASKVTEEDASDEVNVETDVSDLGQHGSTDVCPRCGKKIKPDKTKKNRHIEENIENDANSEESEESGETVSKKVKYSKKFQHEKNDKKKGARVSDTSSDLRVHKKNLNNGGDTNKVYSKRYTNGKKKYMYDSYEEDESSEELPPKRAPLISEEEDEEQ